jgi:general secretion pathway protein B
MSYILDALRRADSERERGAVPGIHALPVPDAAADEPAPRARWTWIFAALAALVVVGAGAWWWGRSASPPAPVAAPLPIGAAPEPAPDVPPPPAVLPPPVATLPAPIERRPTSAEAAAAERRAAAESPGGPAASAAGTSARVAARHELPDEIRRQIPPVTVSGSMYSPDPASRFLIINGQVLHEKGELGPDHVLVQIKLRAAVLRYKGTLYEITF